jgi:hypothetical protein
MAQPRHPRGRAEPVRRPGPLRRQALKAERDALEEAGEWDHASLPWLCEEIEKLEATDKATAPAPAASASAPTTTEPEGDPVAALQAEMEAMLANPEKFSDSERDALVRRFNAQVLEAGAAGAERVDVQALTRDMLAATADPDLGDDQRAELARRYNEAIRQGPEHRTTEALRGALAGDDLGERMRAATALADRGEISEAEIGEVVSGYNQAVTEVADARAAMDPESWPEELRPIVEAQRQALEAQATPVDPVERATRAATMAFDDFVKQQRPPTLAEQLEALGVVQAEQVPEPASQEA